MWIFRPFQGLYLLSWAMLPVGLILLGLLPSPRKATIAGLLEAMLLACFYIMAYVVLRGMGRALFGLRTQEATPAPPVRVRRVILEEIVPYDGATPRQRVVGEDLVPSTGRTRDAR